MKKIKKIISDNRYLLLSLLISFLIISVVFFMRGIYPFGDNPFNVYDFDHAYVPVYYKLWDILHSSSSMFFDWNLGTGLNCFGSLISNSLISPTSLIIGLFNRNYIPYAMSFIIIIKLLVVTFITYISLDKMFPKLTGYYKLLGSILYTYCGWEIFMISNILYLDVFALFPLFVFSYVRLMKENKWGLYVVTLTLCLLLSYYMSWLILFFIIGVTIISLFTLDIKDKKKKAVMVLLLTLISLGLSCILFLPAFSQVMSSYRMSSGGDTSTSYLGETFLKLVYMFPMVIPIYFTYKQLRVKKDKKINLFIILLLIYLLIGIFIPQINAMWHTGSYSGFPFRYSFIPSYILILSSLYYIDNNYKDSNKNDIVSLTAVFILMGIIVFGAYSFKSEYINVSFMRFVSKYSQFLCLLVMFIISLFTVNFINKCEKSIRKSLLMIFSLITIITYNYYFLKNGSYSTSTSIYTENVYENFNLINDGYNYATVGGKLNVNYPYMLRVPSMSNRLHFIKENEIKYSYYLGYRGEDTIIYSTGGNLFNNLIMQNKYYLSTILLDDRLYTLLEEHDGYKLYQSKYNLNYIIPYSGNIINENTGSVIENTNAIYQALFNKDNDILHNLSGGKVKLTSDNVYYIYSTERLSDLLASITKQDDDYFENTYNSYNSVVSEIIVTKDVEVDLEGLSDVEIGYINIDEFTNFVEDINNYDVSVKIEDNKKVYEYYANEKTSILIPVNYDEGLNIKVNGREVDYKLNVYNMVSIDVDKGYNEIVISYVPINLKKGIIISLVSLILLIVVTLTNKKFHYLDKKYILYPLFIITCLIGIIFMLKIYILFWL